MDYLIRQAGPKDMPQVLELIKELAAFEKEPDAVVITSEDLVKDGFGTNPLFTCFVAEVHGIIQGMAIVYYRYSTWKGRTLHLEDLVVHRKMRGTGLGSALYKKVIDYSWENGVKRTEWVVLDWNTPAIDFYQRSGATVLKDWHIVQMDEIAMNAYLKLR